MNFNFTFGSYKCSAVIDRALPGIDSLGIRDHRSGVLIVCDANTAKIAKAISGYPAVSVHVLESGEESKSWKSVEAIIGAALKAGLGRDGLFVGVGGGVVTDITSFASSVYMRGACLALVPTTLLAMTDAALGGKTGIDLFDLKNLVGTFRPADLVYMPTDVLASLPRREWLSGFAEVIKTAILGDEGLFALIEANIDAFSAGPSNDAAARTLPDLVSRCVAVKGRVVEADPTETGCDRALLNLGHTFGHALESSAGLGVLTHGESVAWGLSRACALGVSLGLTPKARADRIISILAKFGYCTSAAHPAAPDAERIVSAMGNDKKKKNGALRFIVPNERGAEIVKVDDVRMLKHVLGGNS